MARKFIFAIVISLLLGVQALSASCDVRCTSMGVMPDPISAQHDSHTNASTPHCHHLSASSDKQASLTANDPCGTTLCRTDLKAITKHANQNSAELGRLLFSTITLPVDPLANTAHGQAPSTAHFSPDDTPLAQRPASLRI